VKTGYVWIEIPMGYHHWDSMASGAAHLHALFVIRTVVHKHFLTVPDRLDCDQLHLFGGFIILELGVGSWGIVG
jgi:hypothetical protein